MKRLIVNLLFVCALVCALGAPARAWNDVGHKISAYIAWQRLSPAARENVSRILRRAPEDSQLGALYPQDSRSEAAKQREHFMIAAYWADIVRDREYKERSKYHKGNWHYADTFWTMENGVLKIRENPGEEGGKAVEKLYDFEKVLRDASAGDAEKAIAVAWFLHLGGDIHQPLHTSARITAEEPKGDQGGNTFSLTPPGTPRENQMNLHWYWDSIVNRVVSRQADAPDAVFLPPIGDRFMKKYPFAKMQNRLNLGRFDEWQKEGFALATREVFPPMLARHQMPPANYTKRAYQISEEQITLAGYRMGEMLNRFFGGAAVAK